MIARMSKINREVRISFTLIWTIMVIARQSQLDDAVYVRMTHSTSTVL